MFLGLLHEAWVSITASRLRAFLAMLGIVIGVGSVVIMVAIGSGSQKAVQEAIDKLGSNLLIVLPGDRDNKGLRSSSVSSLTAKDADAIGQLPSVLAAAPSTGNREFQMASGKLNWSGGVIGTTADFFAIRNWSFDQGEAFSSEDMRLGNRVMVIGTTIAQKLFPDEMEQNANLIGRIVRINNVPFRITGLLASKGQGFDGRDQDSIAIVPLNTAQSKLWGNNYYQGIVQTIFVQAVSKDELEQAISDIGELMRKRHKLRETEKDSFTVRNLTAIAQVASDTTRAFSTLLGAIASISLVVGGIGIMNIMLVTVTERTREIGIRKAIGATERHILIQFLLEAIIIAGVGSLIGLVVGFGLGFAAERFMSAPISYSVWSVLSALGVAATVGILSGLYPAHKAAKLQPIEALRSVGA